MPIVSHVGFSASGGAGQVMQRLARHQRGRGIDSRVVSSIPNNLIAQPLSAPLHALAAGIDNYILRRNDFSSPVSVVRDLLSWTIKSIPEDSDLIHLHWLNGLTDLRSVRSRFPSIPIVWTLHDMNPFTGACHQSLGCSRFTEGCQNCPAVRKLAQVFVEANFRRKGSKLSGENVVLVAPSEWLADHAKRSELLRNIEIRVIPNPLPDLALQAPQPARHPRSTGVHFVVVAADLSDPIKNVRMIVDSFLSSTVNYPEAELHLVGSRGEPFKVSAQVMVYERVEPAKMFELFDQCDFLVSASSAESFGLSIIEGASRGLVPIIRKGSALEETAAHLGVSHTFQSRDELEKIFLQILSGSANEENTRHVLMRNAANHFSPEIVVDSYSRIYEELGMKL